MGRSALGSPNRNVVASAATRFSVTLFTVLGLIACKDLPTIAANVCGNGIREPGEDCDGYADGEAGHYCLPAGHADQCRYSCAKQVSPITGKPLTCPNEMSCGPDLGICRKGTGQYVPWGEFVAVEARTLQLGDLDGDSRDDLLSLGNTKEYWDSSAQVHFFDEDGHATAAFDAFTPLNSPSMVRLTADNSSSQRQIVGGTLYGLATLVANQSGQISSVPYPYLTLPLGASYRMIRMRGVSRQLLGERILFHYDNGNVTPAEGGDTVLGTIPPELGTLIGDPVAANIAQGVQSACDELVFSVQGAAQVYALSVCGSDNALRASTEGPHPIATLPPGHTTTTSPILADVDGDDHLDLVVGDQAGIAHISFGLGDGTFTADKTQLTPDGQLWKAMVNLPAQGYPTPTDAPVPLAIGPLDGQGLSDWVFSNGIALIQEVATDPANHAVIGSAIITNSFPRRSWDFAMIANLNRDDYLDVLAGRKDGSSLDYLKGTGQPVLTGQTIVTPGRIKEVIVGDYDGNQVTDVALIQQYDDNQVIDGTPTQQHGIAAGSSKPFSLAIAFSERDKGPTTTVEVARLPNFHQVVSANYQDIDYTEEIGVLAKSEDGGSQQLILFLGNSTKRPIASLGLWRESDGMNAVPFSTAVVKRGTPGILSVAAEECGASECPFHVWYVPGDSGANLKRTVCLGPVPDGALIQQTHSPGDITARIVVGVANVRVTNPDEDAWLLAASSDELSIGLWRVAFPTSFETEPDADQPLTLVGSVTGRLSPASSPQLIDLDGDGWRDLAVLFDALDGSQRFLVVWGADGNFDFATATSIESGLLPINDLVLHGPSDAQHLYAVRNDSVLEVTADKHRKVFQTPSFRAARDDTPLAGGRTIAIGDVTGDGLPDLAVAVAGGVRLYRQEAKAP